MTKLRFLLAFAAAAALAWWWAATPGTDATEPMPQAHRAPAGSEPKVPAGLEWQRRALSAGSHDLFATPPRPPALKPSPVISVAEAPKAPPLPYKYDGSGELQGKSFVFLARDRRSFMVSAGDTIEATYLVETVARDRVALRYLPLGIRQVMLYAGGEAPPETAAAPERGVQPVALQVDMPAEVLLGQEFVVTLALSGAGALKATIEVGYDHEVLRMVGPGVRSAGRALVELASGNAPRAQLRFKVLTETPAPTDIDLQVSATDAAGKRVPVSTPPAHTVSLVLPGGA